MGDGAGLTLTELEGDKIASHLTDMFTRERATTIAKVTEIKRTTFPALLEYRPGGGGGADRRQRTLRHAAWLLMGHKFDSNAPTELLRKWLRYLTWIGQDGFHPSAKVIVDNNHSSETPAQAILITIKKSIDQDYPITFRWYASGSTDPALKVDVTRTTPDQNTPMTISITSKREVDLPSTIHSSDEDAFYF